MYLPISVPVFSLSGAPLTADVDFMVKALPSGDFFDFGSEYGGSGDNTFKEYASAASPKVPLGKMDAANLDGYYSIMISGSLVSLNLAYLPDGEYLLLAEAISVTPQQHFVNQVGVIDGRLAEIRESYGQGVSKLTIVVKEVDTSGDPIPGVTISIERSNGVLTARGLTDATGTATFYLEEGSYNAYLYRLGFPNSFNNPHAITVGTADVAVELYGSSVPPDDPVVPGTTRVYGYLTELGTTPREGLEVRVWTDYPDEVYTDAGVVISGHKSMVLTDNDGYFYFDLVPQKFLHTAGVIYSLEVHEADFHVSIAANLLDVGGSLSLADLGVY